MSFSPDALKIDVEKEVDRIVAGMRSHVGQTFKKRGGIVGVSGGVWGLDRGYCMMIGGEDDVVKRLDPVFKTLAPGVDEAPRTPGATGEPPMGIFLQLFLS